MMVLNNAPAVSQGGQKESGDNMPEAQSDARKVEIVAICAALAIVSAVFANFTQGFWRDLSLAFMTVFVTGAGGELTLGFVKWVERYVSRATIFNILIGALVVASTGFGLYSYIALTNLVQPEPYPAGYRGEVADFAWSPGKPARTIAHAECSLMSDSAQNLDSLVSYKRLTEQRNSFLRVNYELSAIGAKEESYVGVFCPLSLPPEQSYDISAFRSLHFRMRLNHPDAGQPSSQLQSPASIVVILYSKRPANSAVDPYASPSYTIQVDQLTSKWQPFDIDFSQFGTPDWMSRLIPVPVDPRRVYQVGFQVRGTAGSKSTGHLDIDDVKFSP